jgi:hypothetical protein
MRGRGPSALPDLRKDPRRCGNCIPPCDAITLLAPCGVVSDIAKRVTNVASGNTLVGVAVLAVGSGAEEVVGRVRLNGSS